MDSIIIALIIVIVIAFICIVRYWFNDHKFEPFTAEECGTDPIITIPYAPLSKYDRIPNMENPPDHAQIGSSSGNVSDLARACDSTPGCVGFDSHGALLGGFRPRQYWRSAAGKHTYLHRCAEPEPIYIKWYSKRNFTGECWYIPVGAHMNLDRENITGIMGPRQLRPIIDYCQSMIIPHGISFIAFLSPNCDVHSSYIHIVGNWANFDELKQHPHNGVPAIMARSMDTRINTSFLNHPRVLEGQQFLRSAKL